MCPHHWPRTGFSDLGLARLPHGGRRKARSNGPKCYLRKGNWWKSGGSFLFLLLFIVQIFSIFKIFTINFYWRSKVPLQCHVKFLLYSKVSYPLFWIPSHLGHQEHQVEFLVLYSRLSLVAYFIRSTKVSLLLMHFRIA